VGRGHARAYSPTCAVAAARTLVARPIVRRPTLRVRITVSYPCALRSHAYRALTAENKRIEKRLATLTNIEHAIHKLLKNAKHKVDVRPMLDLSARRSTEASLEAVAVELRPDPAAHAATADHAPAAPAAAASSAAAPSTAASDAAASDAADGSARRLEWTSASFPSTASSNRNMHRLTDAQVELLSQARRQARNQQAWLTYIDDLYKASVGPVASEPPVDNGATHHSTSGASRPMEEDYRTEKFAAPVALSVQFLKARKATWEKEAAERRRRGEDHISFAHYIFLSALRREDVDKLAMEDIEAFQRMFDGKTACVMAIRSNAIAMAVALAAGSRLYPLARALSPAPSRLHPLPTPPPPLLLPAAGCL